MPKKYSTERNITTDVFQTDLNKVTSRYITYPNNTEKRQAEGGLRLKNKFKKTLENKPLVTIITVCFNSEKYLERCILSVLNQTYDNIEYIIIDGGSNDNTINIIKKYEHAIDYFISEPDGGIYFAMNKGLELASGDYIVMLNSDDWFYEYGLESIFKDKNKEYKYIILAAMKTYNPETLVVENTIIPKLIDSSIYLSSAPCHQVTLYSKNSINQCGNYDTTYKIVADWDMFLKIFENFGNNSISYSYSLLTYFSTGGLSASSTNDSYILHTNERMRIFKKYFKELSYEDLEILKVAYWDEISKIYKHFSNFSEQKFSQKFVTALHNFLILKSNLPYANKENIKKPFLEQNSKYVMIKKLKNLKPLEIPYYKDEDKVVVFLASDRNYEPHLYVTISSIIDSSNKKTNYYIYILDGGIFYKDNFYKLIDSKNNFKVFFIDMKDQFLTSSETRHLTRAGYYRLSVFHLFKKFDKVLYLDADSYILSDINKLYKKNIGNHLIAASKDSTTWQKSLLYRSITFDAFKGTYKDYLLKHINIQNDKLEFYFSSGVILFDIKKINLEEKQSTMISLLLNRDYYTHDQDILNLVFNKEEVYLLEREWNYFNATTHVSEDDYISNEEKENYMNMRIEPKIISYVIKPWEHCSKKIDYSDLYWEKIINSPYLHEVVLKLEGYKNVRNYTPNYNRKRTFLEYIFSVYTLPRFIEIYILGIKISIKRKGK